MKIFQQTVNKNIHYSSSLKATGYYDKPNGLVTIEYMVQAILVIYMQGTLSDNPTEPDWFDITLGTNIQHIRISNQV